MKENIIQQKSYLFSLEIIRICRELQSQEKEFVLSHQLLKSGTSIGANIEEAIGAQTKKDFYAKITISYKEARETHYWLRLCKDSNIGNAKTVDMLLESCTEIIKILTGIQKTTKHSIMNS
jgi:four helix bundle protein